ncbi:MAG: hypothetical protein QOH16_3893 [Gaiellaceae bacterium]|nr:hypothetical protein [Gaiellaceae bacterium]
MLTPRIRGGYVARWSALLVGVYLCAVGILAMVDSKLGAGAWAVLQQGIAAHTPLSFGTATVVVSVCVLIAARLLAVTIGVGTLVDALAVGIFIDATARIGWIEGLATPALAGRVALLALGLAAFGFGTALYLSAGLGGGPRDALMLGIRGRTGWPLAPSRIALELSVLAVGFVLGGTVGIGTVAMALAIGPLIEASFRVLLLSRIAGDLSDTPPLSVATHIT